MFARAKPHRVAQLELALTPVLPGRRIQDHHCLPAPFQREAWCARKCRDHGYECATWKGDEPVEHQNCEGARLWNQVGGVAVLLPRSLTTPSGCLIDLPTQPCAHALPPLRTPLGLMPCHDAPADSLWVGFADAELQASGDASTTASKAEGKEVG